MEKKQDLNREIVSPALVELVYIILRWRGINAIGVYALDRTFIIIPDVKDRILFVDINLQIVREIAPGLHYRFEEKFGKFRWILKTKVASEQSPKPQRSLVTIDALSDEELINKYFPYIESRRFFPR